MAFYMALNRKYKSAPEPSLSSRRENHRESEVSLSTKDFDVTLYSSTI